MANRGKNAPPSVAVVQTIADHTGTRPDDLPQPLAEVIDTDSLDRLFEGRDTEGHVQFVYQGMQISVTSDGTIDVMGPSRWTR